MNCRFRVLEKKELAPRIKRLVVHAPLIASKAKTGQFVMCRVDEYGERFPLTICNWNSQEGTITLIFQEVGVSTRKLGMLKVGDCVKDIVGPLGNPSEIKKYGDVAVVGEDIGTALMYPHVLALKKAGNHVVSILGARTSKLLLQEEELAKLSDEIYISTSDGSKGYKGLPSDVLKNLLARGKAFDYVFAFGSTHMMRAVAEVTRPYGVKTVVSLQPIMVCGTGMCGACGVTVGGEIKFACVDGPEFDAHKVDFEELIRKLRTYAEEEAKALHILERRLGGLEGNG